MSILPKDQSGTGAGIDKMASSLGASFDVAISAAIFTALSVGENVLWLEGASTLRSFGDFKVEINSVGGHGAFPELAVDPIVARNVALSNSAVVTAGAFQSGEAGHVIADRALLRLSIRTTTPKDRKTVLGNVRRLIAQRSASFGCTSQIREGVAGAVLTNHPEETRKAEKIPRCVRTR